MVLGFSYPAAGLTSLQVVRGVDVMPVINTLGLKVVRSTPVGFMAPGPRRRRPEKWSYIFNGLCTSARPFTFRASAVNAIAALSERVLFHFKDGTWQRPKYPSLDTVYNCLRPFSRVFAHHGNTTFRPEALNTYADKWYRGRRFVLYHRASTRLAAEGFRRSWASVRAFVKMEKFLMQLTFVWVRVKRLVPRLIQPRMPEYNVAVGRYIRQLEKYIFLLIARAFDPSCAHPIPVVMKGMDAFQQASNIIAAVERVGGDWVAIGIDA